MAAPLRIQGQRFGRLVALYPSSVAVGASKTGNWLFQCDCGEKVVRATANIRSGRVQSCGCALADMQAVGGGRLRHGHCRWRTNTATWTAWYKAKRRCYDRNSEDFARYGGRGIGMCRAWYYNFDQFLADMGEAPAGTSIDRIDNDGHYEPSNCRWATPREQARNRSGNVIVSLDGREVALVEAAEVLGVPYRPLYHLVRTNGVNLLEAARVLKEKAA